MSAAALDQRIASVRRFNRFYTQKIGVLDEGVVDTPFSLIEARVLYELTHRDRSTAAELARDLSIDPGYLSRILRGFRRQGLVQRADAVHDRRRRHLSLTAAGRAAFAPLDAGARREIGSLLRALPDDAQGELIEAMRTIERLLVPMPEAKNGCVLRPHRPGDMGWIVSRHGALYAEEYGWDERFEAWVAEIAAAFIEKFDAAREHCWIAEQDGERVGSVALVAEPEAAATGRLRLLLLEPEARGFGIGRRLVEECLSFARAAGYRLIVLSTVSVLTAARRIYEAVGFRIAHSEPGHAFGHDLVFEEWELAL